MYFCVQTIGSIVLQGKKGSIVLQNLQNHGLKDTIPSMRFPSLPRKRMSTNPPKLPNSPSEKSIDLSENVPNSITTSEKVFDGFLGEKGLFW
jgi:hypothetical protein